MITNGTIHTLIFYSKITDFFLNEQIPEGIIYLQIILFSIWSIWLFGILIRQLSLKSKINDNKVSLIHTVDTDNSPEFYGTEKGRNYQIVTNHIQTIRDAGTKGNQLDIPLLIKNTNDQLNAGSTFLRSVLSLFLILGLLGTLFGLAISLSKFSGALVAEGQLTNEILKQNLQDLLMKLGGAFIPSIVGVLITIISVLLYSIFQRSANIPLGNLIEYKTLTEWVPKYIRPPHQTEKDNLNSLNWLIQEQIRLAKENEEAVHGFKTVAETFKSEAGNLATNVESASNTLKILSESSQNLKEFSEKFVESVSHITSFQQELKNIYEQNAADSKKFNETVGTVLNDNKAFQDIVAGQFKLQSQETDKLFERLKLYEEGYLESRKSIDENLNKLLETASQTYEKIR